MTHSDEQSRTHIRSVSDFILLVGKRMKQCAELHQRRCSERIDEGRVSAQEFAIVLVLTEYGTMPVKDIAARLQGISLSTLTRMLDKLEAYEFITRTLDPGDRRSFLITATEKAHHAEDDYKRQVEGVAEAMLNGLTPKERLCFVELLGKIRMKLKSD